MRDRPRLLAARISIADGTIVGHSLVPATSGRRLDSLSAGICSHYVPTMPSIPSTNRFANRSIRDCARDHMLMLMRCDLCGRTVNYWAEDLAKVIDDPFHEAHVPPWGCGQCRTIDYMSIRWHLPSAQELAAGLTVRRPVRQVVKWIWRDERV
ncbi:hypothetical protein [uncultured Paracoccus sp.]|uniref:hypothetical protein n=1 Tax=uncultured Paracoccus sp. TaxID=189685 RepID=UPI00260BF46C|nr:hypothetical protein [uncultured Paracoccus sp.]